MKTIREASRKDENNCDELLPPNIPHNEAILIPNHYNVRATTSTECKFGSDKKIAKITHTEEQLINSPPKYKTPYSIDLYTGNRNGMLEDRTMMKPPLQVELPDRNLKIRQKIDPDRESQIAWSDEESVHTDWSESNVWSDEDDVGPDKGN